MHYLKEIVAIAEQAGQAILEVYQQDNAAFNITGKADDSPLTAADLASHQLIVKALQQLTPDLPILSEEAADISWDIR
ncbi:MAG TPA: inositol monophosphatase family protein, partial [Rheinheimera sp.]|nr:inositol monophosphatase family protein [Rheinheimera sp.]